jgi:hypothetical protein
MHDTYIVYLQLEAAVETAVRVFTFLPAAVPQGYNEQRTAPYVCQLFPADIIYLVLAVGT